MTVNYDNEVKQLNDKHSKRRIWMRIISVLMCVTVFFTTYALILPAVTLDTSDPSATHVVFNGTKWDDTNNVFTDVTMTLIANAKTTYTLQSSIDKGLSWASVATFSTPNGFTNGTAAELAFGAPTGFASLTAYFQNSELSTRYRIIWGDAKNGGQTVTFGYVDVFDGIKPGFSTWIQTDFLDFFGGSAPKTKQDYLDAFDIYYHVPTAEVSVSAQTTVTQPVTASVSLEDYEGNPLNVGDYTYEWQYYDDGIESGTAGWNTIPGESSSSYVCDPTSQDPIPFGGAKVRCIVKDATGEFVTKSEPSLLNPQSKRFSDIIPTVETALSLSSFPINGNNSLNLTYSSPEWDWVYFDAVANDPGVPFEDKETLWNYLCKVYCETFDETTGTDTEKANAAKKALEKEWIYYRYDIIDPGAKNTNYGNYYTTGTFGDKNLQWVKTNDSDDSFHYQTVANPTNESDKLILPLSYEHLEDGVDYENFVKGMTKYATAVAAGDANSERKYNINMTTDAHAQVKAPIVILFQIQTSWQLFDLAHANALIGEGKTEVGAVAKNSELGTLYEIKHALLDLCEYVDKKYPGNNLVIGVSEVRHGGSDSMFHSSITTSTGSTAPLYVSNNPDVLYQAISQWDVFGNCEHVHYDNDTIKLSVQNLGIDLSDFKDKNENKISYSDIRKAVVVIGGPTENNNNANGYNCILPWEDFSKAGINSIYGVRVNKGTSYAGNTANGTPILSWLDNDGNNSGTYKDGNGAEGFTEKFVCTNRESFYNTFLNIVNQELSVGGLDILETNASVENLTMTDTIRREFDFDYTKAVDITITPDMNGNRGMSATVDLKNLTFSGTYSGTLTKTTVSGKDTYTFVYAANPGDLPHPTSISLTPNADGTVTLDVVYNKIHNTQKSTVNFGIVAKEDYIGSNNVFTNVDVPKTTYYHGSNEYVVTGTDKPQVNVPIDFSVDNGGHRVLYREQNGSVEYDIALNDAYDIPETVQNMVDDYGQINGTLSYVWKLDNGTLVPLDSVEIIDGVVQGDFPDLSYDHTFTEDGIFYEELMVTFTPANVDPNGHFHDVKTATQVNDKERSGVLTFEIVSPDAKQHLTVSKIWKGGATRPDSIEFRLVYEDSAGVQHYYEENGEVRVFTLSSTTNPPWKATFDINPSADIDGTVCEYTAIETEVPGYKSDIKFEVEKEYEYEGSATLKFTPQVKNSGDKIIVYYRYNGEDLTAEFTDKNLTAGTTWTQLLADELLTESDGTPYPASVSKIVYVNNSNTYTVFKNDIDPYDCTIDEVGYPVFTLNATGKVGKDTNITISYKVNNVSKSFTYKVPKEIPNGSEFTVTGTEVILPDDVITDVVKTAGNNCALSTTVDPYIGMRKQYVSFTTPFTLAKDKIVRITLSKVGGTADDSFVAEYTVPKDGIAQGGRIENFVFPDILPDGEYYLSDLVYVDGANETPMSEKTTVTFTTPIDLNKKDVVTVTLSDGTDASLEIDPALTAGSTVVVEFTSNPAPGTTVSSITYKRGNQTNPLTADTKLVVKTPILLAGQTTVTAIIHDNTDDVDITASIKIGAQAQADSDIVITQFKNSSNADVVLDYTHDYTVTSVKYKPQGNGAVEQNLVTPGSVRFTVPFKDDQKIKVQKHDVTLTVKDSSSNTVDTFTKKSPDVKNESGSTVSVLFDRPIPLDDTYTYTLTTQSDKGLVTVDDFVISYGGTMADAFLTVGGMMPETALYIGGQLPDNKVTSDGFNTITASMDIVEGVTIDTGVTHTVNYVDTETGEEFSYTVVPVVGTDSAEFTNTNVIPAGDYVIQSITRTKNGVQMPYYNELNAYLKTDSTLMKVDVTSKSDITNTPAMQMPSTGGAGTQGFVITGLCMMLLSSIIYGFILRRKRERRSYC